MVEYESSIETDELGYNYVKIRPDDGRIYAFSEEFNNEFPLKPHWPAISKDDEAWKEEQRRTVRNIEELQMRLNLQIEADKERLWSDDKLNPIWLIDPYYEPESKSFDVKAHLYSLFYDDSRCMIFSPDAIMFKS